jgi:hypothetical protein
MMATKKKSKPMNGQELYQQTKMDYMIYLEAALESCHAKGIDPVLVLKEFRYLALKQAVGELMGEKGAVSYGE